MKHFKTIINDIKAAFIHPQPQARQTTPIPVLTAQVWTRLPKSRLSKKLPACGSGRKIAAKQALHAYSLWLSCKRGFMAVLGLLGVLYAYPQSYHASVGMGINYPALVVNAEIGHRAGPVYASFRVDYRSNNYPALAVQPIVGVAGSWNNNKMHELTTMAYAFRSVPIASSEVFKEYRYQPFGVGVRHYVHESYYDLSYCNGAVTITMGLHFGRLLYK